MMEEIKMDLGFLGIPVEKLEVLTVKEVREAYHRAAKLTHPDKADRENQEQVDEYNRRFQKIGNAYERILRYIINKLQESSEERCEEKT